MKKNEYFAVSKESGASVIPSTLDAANRSVDVVWYGGQTVPRTDPDTGDEYMLRLDMAGCRMDRLNASAPVFDNHLNGQDFRSVMSGKAGTRAQVGTVLKASADGNKGLATLKFRAEGEDPDTDQLWSGIASGVVNNLSFGTWIYSKKPEQASGGIASNSFVADDWEPFEISPVTVPADFSTQFLTGIQGKVETVLNAAIAKLASATTELSNATNAARALQPSKENPVEKTQQELAAEAARTTEALNAARAEGASQERDRVAGIRNLGTTHKMEKFADSLIANASTLEFARTEFTRATSIMTLGTPHLKHGLKQEFLDGMLVDGTTADQAASKILTQIALTGVRDSDGKDRYIRIDVASTRDGSETKLRSMQNAIILRADPAFFTKERRDGAAIPLAEVRESTESAREYRGFSLLECAKESLALRGINTRGMSKMEVATRALLETGRVPQIFGGGSESSSDFPGILANVANKTLRQAYEAWPQTYMPFSRMVTAADFKPVNRAQLNDIASLPPLGEGGEYKRALLNDSNIGYSLGTFGAVVAITRKAIINDDLSAFTRTSALLGVAAAQRQSDTVWGIITANTQVMQDNVVLFNAAHNNLLTGASSALTYSTATDSTAGLTAARAAMRQQTGPNGTHLNLIPRFIAVGTALETPLLKMIAPTNIASSDVTKVIPEWVRSITPIVEARLDATAPAWYVIGDPAQIDTIEYAFLEGQEGVYFETRQGFEVDGIEMKARMDFAAAAIEQRGLLKNAGQ